MRGTLALRARTFKKEEPRRRAVDSASKFYNARVGVSSVKYCPWHGRAARKSRAGSGKA